MSKKEKDKRSGKSISIEQLTQENYWLRQKMNDLISQMNHNAAYTEQLRHDCRNLDTKLKEEQSKRNALEKRHYKTIQGITHNSEAEVIGTLKEDITRLKGERDENEKQIAELKSNIDQLKFRLGKVGGKMVDENRAFADLSDPYRPQKIAEMVSALYDHKWTEAYEKCTEGENESKICAFLLDLYKASWDFCKENAEKQLRQLEQAFLLTFDSKTQKDVYSPLSSDQLKVILEIRKQTATEMLPNLYEKFKSAKPDVKKELFQYIEDCLKVCWYSTIQEPPVHFVFEASEQPDDFREYTKSGKNVDFVVWPAMYLYENGPILYKGVAQFKD